MATNKVVNDIGVTDALLNGLGVAQVVFLEMISSNPLTASHRKSAIQ